MKRGLISLGVFGILLWMLSGCGGSGINSYYVAPPSQQKDLDQVARDSVSHLSARETAQLNKLSVKK